ncbi:OmpH family outer membrane protein [Psychromonas sp. RZ22]|uniref:OmpH family outer membrane protein n=1 Tax=Psychromonas algarum TaxID=2555643 RepID=UPI0010683358|nr:OmpH family outer membrane protein [Psychromonas sp. RZ22]TEW56694.1 OmpH family outer membrane protein [Psychromonas sp. RZ22]
MKTFLKVITLAATLVTVSAVHAAETQKIGVVFPTKVMQESPQRDKIIKTLEAEFKDRVAALQKLEKEIRTLETKIKKDGELLSNNELTALKRQIEVKVSEYKFMGKAFEEDQRRRQGEEQQKALAVIRDVINNIAKEGHYDLILNGEQVVFSTPALDISDKVIQKISTK